MVITLRHSRFDQDQVYKSFRDKKEFLDLKLCSDSSKDKFIFGHRIILGSVSSVWKKQFLKSINCENPISVKNIRHDILKQIVDYIYNGKIDISEDDFENFSDAYRMINLRLGSQSDKKMYDDNSDGENDANVKIHNNTPVKENNVLKTAINSLDIGTKLTKTSTDDTIGKKHPRQEQDQLEVSSTTSRWHQVKRRRMSPEQLDRAASDRGVGVATMKGVGTEMQTSNNRVGSYSQTSSRKVDGNDRKLCPNELNKGPLGHYWIKIERKNINIDGVADTCRRFGKILELVHLPQVPHVVYVAFETKQAVHNSLKILKICGYQKCTNTTVLPPRTTFTPPLPPTISPPSYQNISPPPPPTISPPPPPPIISPSPPPTVSPPLPPTISPLPLPKSSIPPPSTIIPPGPPTTSPPTAQPISPPSPPSLKKGAPPPLPPTPPHIFSFSPLPPPLPENISSSPPHTSQFEKRYLSLEDIAEQAKQYAQGKGNARKG